MKIKFAWSIILAILFFLGLDCFLFVTQTSIEKSEHANLDRLIELLPLQPIFGRETDNQFLVHNILIAESLVNKSHVDTAFIGTSRSKMIRPSWFVGVNGLNASGNSYNEITYGALLQAEILRRQFPNLKIIFIEASFLLRRPDRLIVKGDHRKYMPLLKEIWPIRAEISHLSEVALHTANSSRFFPGSTLISQGERLQAFNILRNILKAGDTAILPKDSVFLRYLNDIGERIYLPTFERAKNDQPPPIAENHIKVLRLREIQSWGHWDGLFEVAAIWGNKHSIQIFFYEPPVRSDLYAFKVKYGIDKHKEELGKLSVKYQIPYIDLNTHASKLHEHWELFSDEDHLETCKGISYLTAGLQIGMKQFRNEKATLITPSFEEIVKGAAFFIQNYCE